MSVSPVRKPLRGLNGTSAVSIFLAVALNLGPTASNSADRPFVPWLNTANCEKLLKKERPQRLNIWRYYGHPDFRTARHIEVHADAESVRQGITGRYDFFGSYNPDVDHVRYGNGPATYPHPLHAERDKTAEFHDLLQFNQDFALRQMQDTDYIDDRVRQEQTDVSQTLRPNQVTFIDVREEWSASELRKVFGKIPDFASEDPGASAWRQYQNSFAWELLDGKKRRPSRPTRFELKLGTLWLIAGQDAQVQYPLPLQSENLVDKIDRQRFKYVWELGRAAQVRAGAFDNAVEEAVLLAVTELAVLGGDIDRAAIFVHSLDRLHTRHYKNKFGMQEFSGYSGSDDEKVLILPLASALPWAERRIRRSSLFQGLNEEVLEKLNVVEVLKLRVEASRQSMGTLRLAGGERLNFRDFSGVGRNKPLQKLKSRGLSDQAIESLSYWSDHTDKGNYNDVLPFESTRRNDMVMHAYLNGNYLSKGDYNYERLIDFSRGTQSFEVELPNSINTPEKLTDLLAQLNRLFPSRQADLHLTIVGSLPAQIELLKSLQPLARWEFQRPAFQVRSFRPGYYDTIPPIYRYAGTYSLDGLIAGLELEKKDAVAPSYDLDRTLSDLKNYLF